jgi:hypothetical protein
MALINFCSPIWAYSDLHWNKSTFFHHPLPVSASLKIKIKSTDKSTENNILSVNLETEICTHLHVIITNAELSFFFLQLVIWTSYCRKRTGLNRFLPAPIQNHWHQNDKPSTLFYIPPVGSTTLLDIMRFCRSDQSISTPTPITRGFFFWLKLYKILLNKIVKPAKHNRN